MKKTKLSFIALLASLALVGCGGNGNSNGGDSTGGDNPNPSTPAEKTYVVGVKSESKYIVDNVITSKKDIGDAYAMKGTELGEGKVCTLEWFEQAKEIETAVVGKTSSEINSAESFGQATIKVGSLKNAIIEAVDYSAKKHVGPQADNAPVKQDFENGGVKADASVYPGLGYVASFDSAKQQATVTVAYATFNGEGKVVDARFDVVQINTIVTADQKAAATPVAVEGGTDKGIVASKLEKGKNYGMYQNPSELAEVDEQIEALADWSVGKTAAEFATESAKVVYGGQYEEGADKPAWINQASITTSDFSKALANAYAKAQEVTAVAVTAESRAGVGIVVDAVSNSGELSVNISGAMVKGGKVENALVDAVVFPTEVVEKK